MNGTENQGAVYIYTRSADGSWSPHQKLTAADGGFREWFGFSVALDGDTLLVGAQYDDIAHQQQGSVYVFTRTGAAWTQQAKLVASDAEPVDVFGYSVAVSGDTAIVGARYDDAGGKTSQGSAYVFTRSDAVWTERQKLTAASNAEFLEFGYAVDIHGDTAIVGAPGDGGGGYPVVGSISIFVRNPASGVWSSRQHIAAPDGMDNSFFGGSVAVENNTAVVGASNDHGGGTEYGRGAAYVFARNDSASPAWMPQQKLQAAGGEPGDSFGISVAVSGDTTIVGADYDAVGSRYEQGSAYVFKRAGAVWTQQKHLNASNGKAADHFGYSVGVSGNTIVIGAPDADVSGSGFRSQSESRAPEAGVNQGGAYFFGSPLAPTAATVTISGRVSTPQNAGLTNALVRLTDSEENSRAVKTGKSGAFRFENVAAGETYILSVASKRYAFAPQIVTTNEDLTNVDFTAR